MASVSPMLCPGIWGPKTVYMVGCCQREFPVHQMQHREPSSQLISKPISCPPSEPEPISSSSTNAARSILIPPTEARHGKVRVERTVSDHASSVIVLSVGPVSYAAARAFPGGNSLPRPSPPLLFAPRRATHTQRCPSCSHIKTTPNASHSSEPQKDTHGRSPVPS